MDSPVAPPIYIGTPLLKEDLYITMQCAQCTLHKNLPIILAILLPSMKMCYPNPSMLRTGGAIPHFPHV